MNNDLTILTLCLLVPLMYFVLFTDMLKPTLADSPSKQEQAFIDKCDDRIKAILISPSTANIEYYGFTTGTGRASEFSVLARLDSQNGFGTMIRSNMTCSSICAVSGDYMSCGRIEIEH